MRSRKSDLAVDVLIMEGKTMKIMPMKCKVTRQTIPIKDDTDWNSSSWRDIPSELLLHYMGNRPEHFPKTEVKIAYDDTAIYLMFRVEDRYVRQ